MTRKELMQLITDYGAACIFYSNAETQLENELLQRKLGDYIRKINAELIRWQEQGAPKETPE